MALLIAATAAGAIASGARGIAARCRADDGRKILAEKPSRRLRRALAIIHRQR